MKTPFEIKPIGAVHIVQKKAQIKIDGQYIPALTNLKGFSHLQILWWAHLADGPQQRANLLAPKLFKKGPEQLGIFATRAPARPNPIMVSTVKVAEIDYGRGIIRTPFIDAEDGTPVLDIKPYFPMERVRDPLVPAWCLHWPAWQEDTATFDWSAEINFR